MLHPFKLSFTNLKLTVLVDLRINISGFIMCDRVFESIY